MMKKPNKIDFIFGVALSFGLLLHIYFLFVSPFSYDESFYATIPFRLVSGDSLIQHDWHLTQFSSLFSYLPVYIWIAIKGSADSIFIFLRCVYLFIHSTMAIGIYAFFRKHKVWAIVAAMIFYIQMPYRIFAISYHSMFVIFLLLLSLCLLTIYKKQSIHFYIFAGMCFACCCVCNPLFSLMLALYLVGCFLWKKREDFKKMTLKIKASKKGEKLTKKQKKQQNQDLLNALPNLETYSCFFKKEAVLWFVCGIVITAVISIIFYFLTGGTFSSIQGNLENLLGSSEYGIASSSIFAKFAVAFEYFSKANLDMPWILPVLLIILLLDKNKKHNSHRFVYLFVSFLWSILFTLGVLIEPEIYVCAISLPFCVFSTICYFLTEHKNKTLFYCMHLPCLIAAFLHFVAADTLLAALGIVLAINNISGVFFAMDLWKELQLVFKEDSKRKIVKGLSVLCHCVIIFSLCLQVLFYGAFYQYNQILGDDAVKATTGPYAKLNMSKYNYDQYIKTINDLDVIKNRSSKNDPVLIMSYSNWMYLYLDRPIATYSTWYQGSIDPQQLVKYYRENPEKIPKYIYIEALNPDNPTVQNAINLISKMFTFEKENLSNGVLLTIEYRIF